MSATRTVRSSDGWTAYAYGVKSVAVVDPDGNEKLHMQIGAKATDEQLSAFIDLAKSFATNPTTTETTKPKGTEANRD